MARTGSTAKTSTINRVTTSGSDLDNFRLLPGFGELAALLVGCEKDLPPGERLVDCFRLFIQHVASSGLSGKTIRRHVDNLWLLGGEIIRDLNQTPSLRKVGVERLLRDLIHEDGGPLIHNDSEEEQHSFDSTCRKLHRFLTQSHL
jgi:hypothetical protein